MKLNVGITIRFLLIFYNLVLNIKNSNAQFIQTHPSNIKVCSSVQSFTFVKLKRKDTRDSFRWESYDNSNKTWSKLIDNSNWKGTNKDTLYFKNTSIVNIKVRCVIDSLSLKQRIYTSNEAFIISYGQLSAGEIGFNQNKCFGATADTLKITSAATGGDTILSMTWQVRKLIGTYSNFGNINDKYICLGNLKNSQIIRLKVASKSCGSKYSDSVVIKVYDSITRPIITDYQTICYNSQPSQLNISKKAKGGLDSFKYFWMARKIGSSNFSIVDSSNKWQYQPVNLLQTTIFKLLAKSYLGCGDYFSDSVRILVFDKFVKPKISKSQRICYNSVPSNLMLDSFPKGGGDTFNFQWQAKTVLGSWQDISGATKNTYSPPKLVSTTFFRIKAISTKGCGIIYSDSITITVLKSLKKPIISSNQIICFGTIPAELKIDSIAIGGTDTFVNQWQQYQGGSWVNVGTINSSKLNLTNQFSNSFIRLESTSTNLCGSIKSDSIVISVLKALTKPTISQSQLICFDAIPNQLKIMNKATGGNDSFEYQWQMKEINSWSSIPNENRFYYNPSKLQKSTFFRILGNSRMGCGSVFSDSIKISVYEKIKNSVIELNNQFGSAICFGKTPDLKISTNPSGGDGIFFNTWSYSTDSVNYTSTLDTGREFKNVMNLKLNPGFYFFKVKSENFCGIEQSNVVKIKVLNQFVIPAITGNQSICFGTNSNTLICDSNPTGGSGKYQFRWEESTDNNIWSLINGVKTRDFNPGALYMSKYYRSMISDSICGEFPSNSVMVSVLEPIKKAQLEPLPPFCYKAYNDQKLIIFASNGSPAGADGDFVNSIEWSDNQIDWKFLEFYDKNGLKENGLDVSRYYRVKSVSKFGCGTIYSDPIMQVVYDSFVAPVIGNISSNYVVCEDQFLEHPIEMLVIHSKAGKSFKYHWQIKDNVNWIDLTRDTLKTFNRPFYNSDTFRLSVFSNQNCGSVLSNDVIISVVDRPDTTAIAGPQVICKSAKEQFFEVPMDLDYSYNWSVKSGKVVQGQNGPKILVDWENTIDKSDTVIVLRKELSHYCENLMYLPIIISELQAPQPSSVKKVNGTNILVCSDSTPGLQYVWGYFNKKSKTELYETKNGKRYHQFAKIIDTNTNVYFVKTVFGDCVTTSYYSTNLWRLDNPNSDFLADFFEVFPNPSVTGKFEFTSKLDISSGLVYDIKGKVVSAVINGNMIDLSHEPPGVYMFKIAGLNKAIKLINVMP